MEVFTMNENNKKQNIMNLIIFGLAILTFLILALVNTINYFVTDGTARRVIKGIFSILVYVLPVIGMSLAYLTKKKPCLELFLNAGALYAAFSFLD